MRVVTDEKPSLEDLAHFGTKGMHWGIRKKKEVEPDNPKYSPKDRAIDAGLFGATMVKRVNARLNKGEDLKVARKSERRRAAVKGLAIGAAAVTINILLEHGPDIMSSVSRRAENRGRAATLGLMSKAAKTPYSKKRFGVYKVTSL
jgi:hypothetical protein